MSCGHTYCGHIVHNFIIVCVDYQCNPESIGASQFDVGTWIKFLDMNVNDCDVPGCNSNPMGVVVARFSSFPKANNDNFESIKLLQETDPSQGLKRFCTSHEGRFYTCGVRQSSMSSGSMVQVSPPTSHHYFDENKMNTSLINFCQLMLNDLSRQALDVRDSSRQVQCGLLKSPVWTLTQE